MTGVAATTEARGIPCAEELPAGETCHGWRVLAVLSVLLGFASISTDLFLPAIPTIAMALRATPGMIELTISSYPFGFSFGQLLWGPIGDRYGRRSPIATGLVLFIVGSAGCALSGSAFALIGWRVIQALGACASVVLARAMVRDLHAGPRAAQMMSKLMAIMAVARRWCMGRSTGAAFLPWVEMLDALQAQCVPSPPHPEGPPPGHEPAGL